MRPATDDAALRHRTQVVVVAYDGRAVIGECLESLVTDGVMPGDIVVVDNASRDGTVRFLRETYPDVCVIQLEHNVGYGQGANVGVAAASARHVAIVNQDVVVRSGWLDQLSAALDDDPDAMFATPTVLLAADPDRVNAVGNRVHYTGITTCREYGTPAATPRSTGTVTAISGAAFVVRREDFLALGGFDPLYFMYYEDADLSLRALLAGGHALVVPDAEVVHDFEPVFAGRRIFLQERGRLLLVLKIYRFRTLVALLPALALAEILGFGYAVVEGPASARAKLAAWAWFAGRMPDVARSRRRVQRTRTISDGELLAHLDGAIDVAELRTRGATSIALVANALFGMWIAIAARAVRW